MNDIKLLATFGDGTVRFWASGKRYNYYIDTAHHPWIRQTSRFNSGKAFNFVIKNGRRIDEAKKHPIWRFSRNTRRITNPFTRE